MTVLEFLNIIAPEHDRTSCSDENIQNGFWNGRCTRCMYLEIINHTIELPVKFDPEECEG
ncbi:hypothetical protein LCGC14_2169550 [marine sediment metagenome]|uniref:Uncharacterized protein n=1 Tax=marine sediment metagenome TaxID=412755 RepID=A0A0F9GLG8_9ZZZZ